MRYSLVLGLLALCACGGDQKGFERGTLGTEGRLHFRYDHHQDAERVLLTGAEELLLVWGVPALAHATVRVVPEGALFVEKQTLPYFFDEGTRVGTYFSVKALLPGDAQLELLDETGAMIDRVPLRVREAATLDLRWRVQYSNPDGSVGFTDWSSETSIVLRPREALWFDILALDADGSPLVGQLREGIEMTPSDANVVYLDYSSIFYRRNPGTTDVTFSARGANATIQIAVIE